MKECPRCNRNYADEALSYCLEDGAKLVKTYDPDATLVNPYPPAPIVPPTVAYQSAQGTSTIQAPGPAPAIPPPAPAPPRKSPWLVGVLVVLALGVGLAIGGIVFQRSKASPSLGSERSPVTPSTTTPASVTITPTPSEAATAIPNSSPNQSTAVQDSICMLYNDRSDLTVVNVRENCDQRNCELDASTKAGEYADRTAVRVIKGSDVRTANFTWVKIVIVGTERIVWVAASKIKCT
jgi:hypothetical protein